MKASDILNKVHSKIRGYLDINPKYLKIFFSVILVGYAMGIIDYMYPGISEFTGLVYFIILFVLIYLSYSVFVKK